jgi:two-component system chemotaxis sensor kinase CheA
VLDSLPSLASELGKPAPAVRIDDNGYRLRGQAGGTLSNVFMHLLRNSIDHGIETAEARSAQGKPPAGTIDIEVGVDSGALQITLSDDGRGLALERIRGIALERGWIGDDDTLSDEAIANFIFRPGFSTAQTVTEVSGRGVGMDAVRDFLRRENGSIELRFTDDHKGAPFRQFQTIVCLPDNVAVDTLGVQARGKAGELQLDAMAS